MAYIYSVIDRTYNKALLAEYDWVWLKQAVQANKLQVTSDGRWLADPDETGQVVLTPQGRVMLVPRERVSPSDRGFVPFDVFQYVHDLQLALPKQSAVDEEERAFLTEVAVSGILELQEERRRRKQ